MKLKYWKKRCVIRGCIPKHTLTMTCSAVYFLYPAPKKPNISLKIILYYIRQPLVKKKLHFATLIPKSNMEGRGCLTAIRATHWLTSLCTYTITFTYPDWEKLHDFDISYCLILVMSCQTITPSLCEHSFYCSPAQFTTDHCSCVSSSSLVLTCLLCCLCLIKANKKNKLS